MSKFQHAIFFIAFGDIVPGFQSFGYVFNPVFDICTTKKFKILFKMKDSVNFSLQSAILTNMMGSRLFARNVRKCCCTRVYIRGYFKLLKVSRTAEVMELEEELVNTFVVTVSSGNDKGSLRFVHNDLSIPYVTQNNSRHWRACS